MVYVPKQPYNKHYWLTREFGVGMDEHLATHFAHLFIRDPLVIFQETLDESPADGSDHFEVGLETCCCKTRGLIYRPFMKLEYSVYKLATHAV